jgi:hypothetical protein
MAKKKEQTTEVSTQMSDDAVARLLAEAAELDGQNQAELGGNRVPYIKCISSIEDAILDKAAPEYIPKAVYKGFCVPEHKLNLGTEFHYTVMGIFSIYEEKVKPEAGSKEIPPIVGYLMPEQAHQVPIAEGSYFDREFVANDGKTHILSPVFWVFGLIKDHEDIGLCNMVFRSTAAKNAKDLQKILASSGGMSCTQVVKVVAEKAEFKKFNKISYRPMFEATTRINFQVNGGKLISKEWSKEEIGKYAQLYSKLQADYSANRMVVKRDMAEKVAALPEPAKNPKF